jgi:hypothetical protein
MSEEILARNLAAFVAGRERGFLLGPDMATFYSTVDAEDANRIKNCKEHGQHRGVRSFCVRHSGILAFRRVDGHPAVYRAADAHRDTLSSILTNAAMADGGGSVIARIDAMLNVLRHELGSMNKLIKEIHARGICLRTGDEFGPTLQTRLKRDGNLRVSVNQARPFTYARKCLVTLR